MLIPFLFTAYAGVPHIFKGVIDDLFELGLFKSLHVLHLKVLMHFVSSVHLCFGLSFLLPCRDCF